MSHSILAGATCASLLLFSSSAVAQAPRDAGAARRLTTVPERFVERPGQLELSGVLIARPLQRADAGELGLTEARVDKRRGRALKLLSQHEIRRYVGDTDEYLIEVGVGGEQAAADALMARGDFEYVTPDWTCYPIANCTNDSSLPSQWHHNTNRMNSCNAWDIHTGDPSTVVAICDTGVRTTHTDLDEHRQEGFNAVTNLWESAGGQINDINGHGTATTGCAAANGNNNNGISGAGWDLGHRMMRVSNSAGGSASLSDLTQAARLASDVGDRVASVSYSGVTSSSVQTTGTYVRNNGALLIWAAGNDGNSLSGNREDDVIVVGATTSSDSKSSFSNFGPFVDLMAPGSSIFTTTNSGNNSYGSPSGTSFACPLVAGICGLIFSADPSLTPDEVEAILRAGCDDLGSSGVDNTFGYGRVDMGSSMGMVDSCGAENYCTAFANTTGSAAQMFMSGSVSVAANDLVLTAAPCPIGQFGLFFFGGEEASGLSGDGRLCVGGSLRRFGVVQVDFFGMADQVVDLTSLPGGASVSPGDLTHFSFWFRDSSPGGWNFSDGLRVEWCN